MGCDCVTSCFVFNSSVVLIIYKISQLYCLLAPILVTLLPSCVQRCQMLSGNQSTLNLNACSFSCRPHVLLVISLVDPCNVFALLAVRSALPNVWKFLLLLFLLVLHMVVKHVMGQQFLTSLLAPDFGSK